MKIQIDPGAQIVVAIGVSVLTAIGKGAIALPLGVPAWVGDYVVSWSNFVLQLYAPVAAVMLAYSSSRPGPLAPPDPPSVVAAEKAAQSK